MDNFSKQIYEAGINDGRAEGKAEGLAEGKAESIKNLMSTMNVSIPRDKSSTLIDECSCKYLMLSAIINFPGA